MAAMNTFCYPTHTHIHVYKHTGCTYNVLHAGTSPTLNTTIYIQINFETAKAFRRTTCTICIASEVEEARNQ